MAVRGRRGGLRCAEQARVISARAVERTGTPRGSRRGGSVARKRVRK
jgi:hypothetical protein